MLWMDEKQVNNQTKIADDDELTITLLFNNQTGYCKSRGFKHQELYINFLQWCLIPGKSHLRFPQNSFEIPSKIFIKSTPIPSNELSITTSLIRLNHQTGERHNKTDHGGYANINNGTGGHTDNHKSHQISFCTSPGPGE